MTRITDPRTERAGRGELPEPVELAELPAPPDSDPFDTAAEVAAEVLGARPVEDRGRAGAELPSPAELAELGCARPYMELAALAGDVAELAAWLDRTTGRDLVSLTCAVVKVAEEAGEAVGAWINHTANNPRKPAGALALVTAELGDVALSALVALARLGVAPLPLLAEHAADVVDRAGLAPELQSSGRSPSSEPGAAPAFSPPTGPAGPVPAELLPGRPVLPAATLPEESSWTVRTVVEVRCVECGVPAEGGEQGALIFPDRAAALAYVVGSDPDPDSGPYGPWRVIDAERVICRRCVVTAECAELGCDWSPWYRHPRDPNTGQRERLRECRRCWRVEYAAPSSAPRLVPGSPAADAAVVSSPSSVPSSVDGSADSSAGGAGATSEPARSGSSPDGSDAPPKTVTQRDALDTGARFVVISGGVPGETRGDGGRQ
jgi:hypothetical protein